MAEILILGSGTGVPSAKRGAPGYLLTAAGKNVVIDSGPGTLGRLIQYEVTYKDIDYLFYTHFHPDHTLDLAAILFASRNPKNPRTDDLLIAGPKGIAEFYDRWLSLYGNAIRPETYKVVFKELGESELEIGGLKVISKKVAHTDVSLGIKIEVGDGRSVVYSGDTGYCDSIVELSKGASLLILECSAPDEFKVKGHLSPSSAGEIASRAQAERLVLSHFYPICDRYPILKQCRAAFKGKIVMAKDGMRLKI